MMAYAVDIVFMVKSKKELKNCLNFLNEMQGLTRNKNKRVYIEFENLGVGIK